VGSFTNTEFKEAGTQGENAKKEWEKTREGRAHTKGNYHTNYITLGELLQNVT